MEIKNEENLAKTPSPGNTISLRDGNALIQNRAPIRGKGLDVSRLLKGLQDGLLSSGFFVGTDPILWVPISSRSWIDVTTVKFKCIRAHSNRQGGFFVTLEQFPAEYAAALMRSHKRDEQSYKPDCFAAKLTEALAVSSMKREVHLIVDESWREYIRQLPHRAVEESVLAPAKRGSGRREKGDWKLIYRVLTAQIIANGIEAISKQPRIDLAKEVIVQAYQLSEGKIDAPGIEAVIDEIGYLLERLDGMRIE
jgi:hypothetical protein